MHHPPNDYYQYLEHRLKQQEECIAQLLKVLAVTNKKVTDIDQRQSRYEIDCLQQSLPSQYFVTSNSPAVPTNTPHL